MRKWHLFSVVVVALIRVCTGRSDHKILEVVVGGGSVTANIGWYVVSILHDQPSCNIDITWPVESTLWVAQF